MNLRVWKSRHGFTMVELLVVVVLAVVLVSVVTPLYQMVRSKARQAACAGNMRGWGAALAMHAADHNGALPRRGQGRQKLTLIDRPEDWFNALPAYLGRPSYHEMVATGGLRSSEGVSIFECPDACMDGNTHPLGYGMNMNLSPWNFPNPSLLPQISSPSTVVFMAEAPGDYSSVYPSAREYSLTAPHSGSGNVLFVDGHVEAYRAEYLGCHKGDPGRHDVSWKTGTDSDANSDFY